MILLLDAHALVWWLADRPALSRVARAAIANPANDVLVSAASVWELAIKRAAGKIRLGGDIANDIAAAGFKGVPILLADAESAAVLPAHHRDPFDRMLVAQANRLDAVIVTRDKALAAYDVAVMVA